MQIIRLVERIQRIEALLEQARLRAAASSAVSGNFAGTTGGPDVSLGDLVTPSDAILFAMDVTPASTGIFRLSFALRASMSADDEIEMSILVASGLTAISGGAAAGNGRMHYETLGSPVVLTSNVPVEQSQVDFDTTFGGGGELYVPWAGVVQVPAGRSAILVTLTGPVATYTGIKLNAFGQEAA